jgi:hypothetical protein
MCGFLFAVAVVILIWMLKLDTPLCAAARIYCFMGGLIPGLVLVSIDKGGFADQYE